MNSSLLALLALAPMITGPLPQAERSFTATMCGGGSITIPLGNRDDQPERDCHPKGCHAGTCREKSKRHKLI